MSSRSFFSASRFRTDWNCRSMARACSVLEMFSNELSMKFCSLVSRSWMFTLNSRKSRSYWFLEKSSRSYGLRLNSSATTKNRRITPSMPSILCSASCVNCTMVVNMSTSLCSRFANRSNFPNARSSSKSNWRLDGFSRNLLRTAENSARYRSLSSMTSRKLVNSDALGWFHSVPSSFKNSLHT